MVKPERRWGTFTLLLFLVFAFYNCSHLGVEHVHDQQLTADPTFQKSTKANDASGQLGEIGLQFQDLATRSDISQVMVNISHINIYKANQDWFTLADFGPEGLTVDLLGLSSSGLLDLAGVGLNVGSYAYLEIVFGNEFAHVQVTKQGRKRTYQSTLKMYLGEKINLGHSFNIIENVNTTFTVAFALDIIKDRQCLKRKFRRYRKNATEEDCRVLSLNLNGLFVNAVNTPLAIDDADGDGVADDVDNCKFAANPDQADSDNNGIGDVCDFGNGGNTGGF